MHKDYISIFYTYNIKLKSYKFGLYPSKVQQRRISAQFDECCGLYNVLLQKCKDAYKKEGLSLNSKSKLCELIRQVKTDNPELKQIYSQVLQNCADKLSKAYANFFRRTEQKRAGKKTRVGFPRYKKHFHSITYPQFGFKLLSQRRLKVSKIGSIPIVLHRDYNSALVHLKDTVGLTGSSRLWRSCLYSHPLGWLQAGSWKQELHAILLNFEEPLGAHDFSCGRMSQYSN
jgi:putative transposase